MEGTGESVKERVSLLNMHKCVFLLNIMSFLIVETFCFSAIKTLISVVEEMVKSFLVLILVHKK